jgi:putative thioredoxin
LEQLLTIVKKDRNWEDDKARKKIVELLDAFGEDDPITSETRLKLSSIIFA